MQRQRRDPGQRVGTIACRIRRCRRRSNRRQRCRVGGSANSSIRSVRRRGSVFLIKSRNCSGVTGVELADAARGLAAIAAQPSSLARRLKGARKIAASQTVIVDKGMDGSNDQDRVRAVQAGTAKCSWR